MAVDISRVYATSAVKGWTGETNGTTLVWNWYNDSSVADSLPPPNQVPVPCVGITPTYQEGCAHIASLHDGTGI